MEDIQFLGDFESLKQFEILKCIEDEQLAKIAARTIVHKMHIGENVFVEGSLSSSMFLIKEGQVEVLKDNIVLASIEEGEYFGEMSYWSDQGRSASIRTSSECVIYELNHEIIEQYLSNNVCVLQRIIKKMNYRLRRHNKMVVDQFYEIQDQYFELQDVHTQLLKSDKLATIGMLTAGVAHEINNPLSIIDGYIPHLKKAIENNDQGFVDKCLDRMGTATASIKEIVKNLKTFVSTQRSHSDISLNKTILSSIELVSYLYKKAGISIRVDFDIKKPHILGDMGAIQQILTNLLANSKDALQGKEDSIITIKTKVIGNSKVRVVYQDNGPGINEELKEKIFEKFFTTKEAGVGSGLGLDIVKQLVEQMNGTISVGESGEGSGACFNIDFPLVD